MGNYNPNDHLINLKGKAYLPVAARLVWFREDHPTWGIVTAPVEINHVEKFAVFTASIFNDEGRLIATGTKMEDARGFGDFLEKAETGSVGRALALCGYGTQFAPELEEGTERIVDTPQDRQQNRPNRPAQGNMTQPATNRPPAPKIPQDDAAVEAPEQERNPFAENDPEGLRLAARDKFRITAARVGKPCINDVEEGRLINRTLQRTGMDAKRLPTPEEYKEASRLLLEARKAEIIREQAEANAILAEGSE